MSGAITWIELGTLAYHAVLSLISIMNIAVILKSMASHLPRVSSFPHHHIIIDLTQY